METIIVSNVKEEKLQYYRDLAKDLGGALHSINNEPDGEYTLVILVPKKK